MSSKKVIIFSAPSGAGKITVVKHLLQNLTSQLSFSISACSRAPRQNEVNGKDYHFLSVEDFKKKIENKLFLEWEEVYPNLFYGTLLEEVERIWSNGKTIIFLTLIFLRRNHKFLSNNTLAKRHYLFL